MKLPENVLIQYPSVKPLAFFALLAALVVLGCASVAREESRRVYVALSAENIRALNTAMDRGLLDPSAGNAIFEQDDREELPGVHWSRTLTDRTNDDEAID